MTGHKDFPVHGGTLIRNKRYITSASGAHAPYLTPEGHKGQVGFAKDGMWWAIISLGPSVRRDKDGPLMLIRTVRREARGRFLSQQDAKDWIAGLSALEGRM